MTIVGVGIGLIIIMLIAIEVHRSSMEIDTEEKMMELDERRNNN